MTFQKLFVLAISTLFLAIPSQAQDGVFYEDTYPDETSICAWSSALLYESPGRNARRTGTVLFTEELEHLGREAFVRGENRNYIWVKSKDGKIGWINDSYIVRNGGVVVILENVSVYERPSTISSRTSQRFIAGDLAVLSDFRDGWVQLFGEQKYIQGWVEGYDRVSVEAGDIEIASLLTEAMRITNPEQRRTQLRRIGSTSGMLSNEMTAVIQKAIAATYPAESDLGRGGSDFPQNNDPFIDEDPRPNPNRPLPPVNIFETPGLHAKEVVDMQTGKTYERIYESGTIQPVKSKKAKDEYYAYHKTLPIGSSILLKIPGYDGWVQLEIVARLKSTNEHIIGLDPKVIQSVFGESQAKNVKIATISYPRGGF